MSLPPHPVGPSSPDHLAPGDVGVMYRSPRARAKLATAALVLDLAALTVVGLLLWDSLSIARALAAGEEVSEASIDLLQQRASQSDIISFLVLLGCALMFCLWTYRVARNAVALGGQLSVSPGSAVGYYFIPIINWWMPYTALAQVWDASDPDPRAATRRGSHALLLGWWLAWLVSYGVDLTVLGRGAPESADEWANQIALGFLSIGADAIAAVLAIAVIWKLTRRQEERAAAMWPSARVA
ncbi:MAG TPA: DUF4328 domain-containing protein [Kofleriaceae bacterium]|nr:DUF4328 domain-containing protein [Kofleriaceae bacterium]